MCGALWAGLEPTSPSEARVELRRRPSWACWKPSFWLGSHFLSVELGVGPRLELDQSTPTFSYENVSASVRISWLSFQFLYTNVQLYHHAMMMLSVFSHAQGNF